jgi:hypothetical protein
VLFYAYTELEVYALNLDTLNVEVYNPPNGVRKAGRRVSGLTGHSNNWRVCIVDFTYGPIVITPACMALKEDSAMLYSARKIKF